MQKVPFKWPENSKFHFEDATILCGYRGSIAHGMFEPSDKPLSIDDKDVMGVCVPPIEFYFGLRHYEQTESFIGEWDTIIYELKKYISLLLKCNPNVLSLLWLDENYYIKRSPFGDMLIKNRDWFSSKKSYFSFTGYAHGQLHRMTHYKFEGYMGAKRKAIVDKFGYDVKNAAHLIRLLRMGIEFISTGKLNVKRHDASELLEIKHGEWSLEKVKEHAEELFALSRDVFTRTILPDEPESEKIDKMLIEILSQLHFGKT